MISRASSDSDVPTRRAVACFPSARGGAGGAGDSRTLPERPRWKEPVLDPKSCSVPICEFDDEAHSCFYGSRRQDDDDNDAQADLSTAQPDGFSDEYLMPSLARNERLRLTMLWYHTHGLLEDKDFQARLHAIVGLVQSFFQGWEFAIMGFVFEDAFTRIATAGMPLAMVPRRESPCSHTVTQVDSGQVFFLPDMRKDWRFKASPTVRQGLRGYAGAQLRCDTPGGERVALGSLCIASSREQPELSSDQRNALVRFADMLSAEIVSHSREARLQQRQVMARLLAECRLNDLEDAETRIVDVVRQIYPQARVEFVEPSGEQIPLPAHAPIDLCQVNEGLWEDTDAIDRLIKNSNHEALKTTQTARAIIHQVQTFPVARYLVVASTHLQTVFDDVDSWFVQKCAMSLGTMIHERMFGEALMVKERFLRGITHQLRTPIHGVLGSCELLTEELATRKWLTHEPRICDPGGTVFTILDAIRDSGKELMTTVNNMLKLNRWAETTVCREPASLEDWTRFEDDILSEVAQVVSDYDHANVSIFFNNCLFEDKTSVSVDIALLKECIQSLFLNAMQATRQGSITITTNAAPDHSYLQVDVTDTGCGIAPADQQRIFEAYEKVDEIGRGAGLGLTLAANIAKLMHGNVTLLRSSQDAETHGSHFRATIATLSPTVPTLVTNGPLSEVPRGSKTGPTFHRVSRHEQECVLTLNFAQYLERQGLQQTEIGQGSIALFPHVSNPDEFAALLKDNSDKMCVCLMPAGATLPSDWQHDNLRTFSGPFTSSRLKKILNNILRDWEALQHTATAPETNGTLDRPTISGGNSTESVLSQDSPHLDPSLRPEPSADIVPHALLVDDNMVNLKIMRMYCEKRGIAHVIATNGREAVDAFKAALEPGRQPLNLVLMDLQMPVCDGADATREIRELELQAGGDEAPKAEPMTARRRTCIFMVTGQDSLADKARSFAVGADEFYVKPMGMKKLDAGIGLYFPCFGKRLGVSAK